MLAANPRRRTSGGSCTSALVTCPPLLTSASEVTFHFLNDSIHPVSPIESVEQFMDSLESITRGSVSSQWYCGNELLTGGDVDDDFHLVDGGDGARRGRGGRGLVVVRHCMAEVEVEVMWTLRFVVLLLS